MKVFVTGGTGFIGSNLVEKLLSLGFEVCNLIRKEPINSVEHSKLSYFLYRDLENLINFFKDYNPDIVIHLAAYQIADHKPSDINLLISSNILLISNVLEAMKHANVKKIVNTSTNWQHYENKTYSPTSLYAATKQCAEDVIKFYSEAYGISCINLTLFDSYGANDPRKKLLNFLVDNLDSGREIELTEGLQKIDLVHVSDIVNAYLQSIERINASNSVLFEKFSISSGNSLTIKDLVKSIEKISNKKLNILWGKKPYRNREMMTPWSEGEILPNWYPNTSLETGLKLSFK